MIRRANNIASQQGYRNWTPRMTGIRRASQAESQRSPNGAPGSCGTDDCPTSSAPSSRQGLPSGSCRSCGGGDREERYPSSNFEDCGCDGECSAGGDPGRQHTKVRLLGSDLYEGPDDNVPGPSSKEWAALLDMPGGMGCGGPSATSMAPGQLPLGGGTGRVLSKGGTSGRYDAPVPPYPPPNDTTTDPQDWTTPQDEADAEAHHDAIKDLMDAVASDASPKEIERLLDIINGFVCPADPPPIPPPPDPCMHPWYYQCDKPDLSTLRSLSDADINAAADDVKFSCEDDLWDSNPDAEDVLTRALAMLQDSIDIVKYSCCLYFGPYAKECDCLVDYIMGDKGKIRFCAENEGISDGTVNDCAELYNPSSLRLDTLKVTPSFFNDCSTGTWFNMVDWGAADADSKTCMEATLAAALAHELMHSCEENKTGPAHEPPFDYGWVGDFGTATELAKCDLTTVFSLNTSGFSRSGGIDNVQKLMEDAYCPP